MKTIEIEITEIRPYEKNNKKHPQSQVEDIAESIRQFGFKQPIVVDKDKVIIIGHGRYAAAKMLGMKTVPCVVADDLTEEQVKKLRIVDNKTNESEWDIENTLLELKELSFDEFNFNFDDILKEEKEEVEDDNFDFDKAAEEVPHTVKRGDIYKLGNHRLMCGDSTSEEDVMKLVAGGGY